MNRISDDKKDHFVRENTMASSSAIRNIQNLSQTLEKDKTDKAAFVQHNFSSDSNYRAHDLLKPSSKQQSGRSLVTGSLGPTQLHSMPPLLPNYITGPGHIVNPVPINHTPLMRNTLPNAQHGFPTHIQTHIGIGTVSAIAAPRGNVSLSQRGATLPTLKPTNLPNQIQLPVNQIPGLPTILPPNATNRTNSPATSSHERNENRGTVFSDHGVRGNLQAGAQPQATIQVIASGTAVQQGHLPATFLNKGMHINSSNMLKISVSSNSSSSNAGIPVSAFKLGLGKPGVSSVIIPASTGTNRTDIQEIRHVTTPAFNRFPVNHILSTVKPHTTGTAVSSSQSSVTISSMESRSLATGVPYHPVSAAYVFRDMGINFPHQLIRPPAHGRGPTTSVNSLPTFMPIVSIAVSSNKGNAPCKTSQEDGRADISQGNTSFNIQSLYPNFQTQPTSSQSPSTIESSIRPSILRKRPAENIHPFPVQPTEKERVLSPLKSDAVSGATRIYSPGNKPSDRHDLAKPINHSIVSITSDTVKTSQSNNMAATTNSTDSITTTTNSTTHSFRTNITNHLPNHLMDASPKKKPRKQSIITTEDKYNAPPISNSFNTSTTTDVDEEFLKSNETMKDVTPPKLTPSTQISNSLLTSTTKAHTSVQKPLFDTVTPQFKTKLKQETKEVHLNGMLAPLTTSANFLKSVSAEPTKVFVFRRRRPQHGILNEHKINTKAAHNHFYRHSDVRKKDEKKITNPDHLLSKASVQSASGWRLQHLKSQLDDMVSLEKEILEHFVSMKEDFPEKNYDDLSLTQHPSDSRLTADETQLFWIQELLLGNIQRCNCFLECLGDVSDAMFKVLNHKPKVFDIIKSHKLKPRSNKKKVHT